MVLKLSSQVFSEEAELRVIKCSLARDDLQYRVNLTFEEAILEQKRKLNTIVVAVVRITDLVLSGTSRSLVDAVRCWCH